MPNLFILVSEKHPKKQIIEVAADVECRLLVHNQGLCPDTVAHKPWRIKYLERLEKPEAAFKRLRKIKRLNRAERCRLFEPD